VTDVKTVLKEVAGTDHQFRLEEFLDAMRSRLVSVFSDALASAKVPVLDVATRYGELGEALLPLVNQQTVPKYGIEFASFIIENVSVPEEVEKAIDKRSSMAAIGNLNDYVKFQMAEAMTRGDAGGGLAGSAAQLGAGLAMGQQMMAAMTAAQTTPPAGTPPVMAAAPAPTAGTGLPELLGPAQAAEILGVTEADVLAALTDGSLKGKKIGTAWRITRANLEEFLKS
jgi:excisionase family DNA binding protein